MSIEVPVPLSWLVAGSLIAEPSGVGRNSVITSGRYAISRELEKNEDRSSEVEAYLRP
jgi:hypothetical protein